MDVVPGHRSALHLKSQLLTQFGSDVVSFDGDLSPEQDGFGFWPEENPKWRFSVSTHAGDLPNEVYDLQVSLMDDSINRGDVSFDDETDVFGVLEQVRRHLNV